MKGFIISILLVFPLFPAPADVQAASPAVLHPVDRLVIPGDEVKLKVRLMSGGLGFLQRPISGERVEFIFDERLVGQALTDGNGWAVKRFKPQGTGTFSVTVQLEKNSKLKAEPVEMILALVPPATPLLLVHLSTTRTLSKPPATPFSPAPTSEPMEGAVEELEGLSEKFQLVYLETGSENLTPRFREWVFGQGFPEAPLLVWPVQGSPDARRGMIKDRIGDLREGGGRTIVAGVFGSAEEAEALSELKIRSLLMVEEAPDSEDIPEGVEAVTGWRGVSSFLIERRGGRDDP